MKNLIITLIVLASQTALSQTTLTYKFIEYDNQITHFHKLFKLEESRDIIMNKNTVEIEDSEYEESEIYYVVKRKTEEWGYWYELSKDGVMYILEISSDEYQIVLYSDIKNQTFFYTK